MKLSNFAKRFSSEAGIVQLMKDLGAAMSGEQDILMLGGGNPSHIPEVQQYIRERAQRLLEDPTEFAHVIGDYDSPQGEKSFIEALANLFRKELGWNITPENIALTAGSQSGFFLLFNMFGGDYDDGTSKKILLPMTPEYIGYADVGLSDNMFVSRRSKIKKIDQHTFKYHIDFSALDLDDTISAICVSRPTNPTGNVLSNEELKQLLELADKNDIPLIIDNAYGLPFPNIVFTDITPLWTENTIVCMSLSKIGLPGTRTGIIVASPDIIGAISNANAVLNLALGSFGPALAYDLIASGEIIRISQQVIKPYYQQKAEMAVRQFREELDGIDYYIHKAEGALFLWLWLPELSISSEELYHRLKQRGVLVISGHHFFPGLMEDWKHKHECIRVTYSMKEDTVRKGIKIISEEIRKAIKNQDI